MRYCRSRNPSTEQLVRPTWAAGPATDLGQEAAAEEDLQVVVGPCEGNAAAVAADSRVAGASSDEHAGLAGGLLHSVGDKAGALPRLAEGKPYTDLLHGPAVNSVQSGRMGN